MRQKIKMHYRGSIFWLIFWVIVFFPVAIVLLATSSGFQFGGKEFSLHYDGSAFWLCFWTVLFFPVAIILGLINGFSVAVTDA